MPEHYSFDPNEVKAEVEPRLTPPYTTEEFFAQEWRNPVNPDSPIELTREEYTAMQSENPRQDEVVQQIMETKQIPTGTVVRIRVDGRDFDIGTYRDHDFGVEVQH
jgi:hypothetical protein